MVNETRAQFTHSTLAAEPNDASGPSVSISGVASFGRLSGSPTRRDNNLWEIADNLSYQRGAHAIRVGVAFLNNSTTITYPRSIRGSYSFSSLANFLNGTYNNAGFTQTFGNSVVSQSNPNVGFYAQDEWKLHPRFTLNLGLRYDLQFLETIATDTNNLSPRAGFALVSLRVTLHRHSRQLRFVLRPRPAARSRQCAPVQREYHHPYAHQPDRRQSQPRSNRRARLPEHPDRRALRGPGQLHHHASADAERLLGAGQLRGRTATGTARHDQRGISTPARSPPDHVRSTRTSRLHCFRQ